MCFLFKTTTTKMKQQLSLLASNLKNSILAFYGIALAFLTPIIPLMVIVFGAILLDTVFGILRARKVKEEITSRRLSKIISKLLLYQLVIILAFSTEKFILSDIIGIFCQIHLIGTKLVTTVLLFIEGTSISENYKILTGVSIWQKAKELIGRGKELKKDIKDIVE